MTVVHEPSLQLFRFAAPLPRLLYKSPWFCALCLGELATVGFSLCESLQAFFDPWSGRIPEQSKPNNPSLLKSIKRLFLQ
jgi:hypothetical protein